MSMCPGELSQSQMCDGGMRTCAMLYACVRVSVVAVVVAVEEGK